MQFRVQLVLAILLIVTSMSSSHAQESKYELPRGLTEEENYSFQIIKRQMFLLIVFHYLQLGGIISHYGRVGEIQSVVITWTSFQAILAEIVRNLQKECNVIIVCNNETTVKII